MAPDTTGDGLGIAGLTDPVEIGRGGFGVVYRARQAAFGREVAVKLLSVPRLDDDAQRRFERECLATGRVSTHPNIVTVLDAGVSDDGRPYLVMEHLPGGSLADRVARDGPVPWREAVAIAVALAGALETAHRLGVLHRDIKPENILLSAFGDPCLADFGIARVQGGTETRSGVISASLAHAPPEVLDGARPSAASDVYALASTVHGLIRGTAPFVTPSDETLHPLMMRIFTQPPPDLREQGVPDDVASVLERALAKDPAQRWPTAEAFGEALRGAQAAVGGSPTDLRIVDVADADADAVADGVDTDSPAPTGAATPDAPAPAAPVVDPDATLARVRDDLAVPATGEGGARRRLALAALAALALVLLLALAVALAGRPAVEVAAGGDGGSTTDGVALATPSTSASARPSPSTRPSASASPAASASPSTPRPTSSSTGAVVAAPTSRPTSAPTTTATTPAPAPSPQTSPTPTALNSAPLADARGDYLAGREPLTVNWTGEYSEDSDGTIVRYAWDFGDGGTATGMRVAHTFTSAGTYTVRLTVTDDDGATGWIETSVTVSVNDPPIAHYAANPGNGPAPLDVTFDAGGPGTGDPNGDEPVTHRWDFGDGSTMSSGTETVVRHTFASPGTYTVVLTVTDTRGKSATYTDTVQVS